MKNILYILNIIIAMLFFASCDEDEALEQDDDRPCYTLRVSLPTVETRASYEETADAIKVKWEKGDKIKLKIEGEGEYLFLWRSYSNGIGEFYCYDQIPLTADNKFKNNSVLSFNDVVPDANQAKVQTQEKNNDCREYLFKDVSGEQLTYSKSDTKETWTSDVIDLSPAEGYSLLHIQAVSPGMFIGTSQLKIVGLDTEDYIIKLGSDPSHVFVDEGELLDIFIIVPDNLTIKKNKRIEFYFYAYDEATNSLVTGEEFRYYMMCTSDISTADYPVIKLPLPSKAKNIIHIFGKAPADLPVGSKLILEGWKQETSGEFTEAKNEGEDFDMYLTVPDLAKITNQTTLKFYIYAFDNVTGKYETGDEYHYYTEFSGAKNNSILNLELPELSHAAIQLGLSVKWATMNIGATSDQPGKASYGGYYSWGLVETNYDLARNADPGNYYYHNKGSDKISEFFSYSANENSGNGYQGMYKEQAGLKYGDAATFNWGEKWITPNYNQMHELFELVVASRDRGKTFTDWAVWNKNSWESGAQPQQAGNRPTENGWWVYGKGAYSDKKIWLPAAGCVLGSGSYNANNPASSDGYIGLYMTTNYNYGPYGGQYNASRFLFFDGRNSNGNALDTDMYHDVGLPFNIFETYNGQLAGNYFFNRNNGISVRPIRNPNK